MSNFSIGDALGGGFGVIAKRPLSVLAWAVVYLVLVGIPHMARMAEIQPALTAMMKSFTERAASGGSPDVDEVLGFYRQMFHASAWSGLSLLGSLLAGAILSAAIYRAVLEPGKKSFASLRFGAQELWLILLGIVAAIVLAVAGFVIGAVAGILIGLLAGAAHQIGGVGVWLLGVAICIGAIFAFLLICVRLSLAGPLTFSERQFRLFESWGLTKGHAWKLFGLAILLILILLGLEVALAVVSGVIRLALLGVDGFDPTKMAQSVANGDWWRPQSPQFLAALIVHAIAHAGITTVMLAPWAVAYRELSGRPAEHAAVF